jgi:hypothetical protein
MHSLVRHAAVLPVLALLAACASPVDAVDGVSSAHSEGEVHRRDASPFHWANVGEDALDLPPPSTPADDPLRVRLQAWADRIDTIVVARAREQSVPHLAPHPIVHVVKGGGINAWAAGALFATGASFGREPGFVYLSTAGLWMADEMAAIGASLNGRPAAWPSNRTLLDAWSAASPTCDLSEAGPDQLISERCVAHGTAVLAAQTPHVYMTSDLLSRVDETAALSVLAHELGHYYRAHASSLTVGQYDFWYDGIDGSNRPVSSARAAQIASQYADVFQAPSSPPNAAKVYHRRMVGLLTLLAFSLAVDPAAASMCSPEVREAAYSPWLMQFLRSRDSHESLDLASFQKFEQGLAACAGALNLGPASSGDTMVREKVAQVFATEGFASLGELETAGTLAAALELARTASIQMDRDERSMLDALRTGRIGLYTAEQEADEIMFEVVTSLGVAPKAMFDAWLDFMAAAESDGAPRDATSGDLGARDCRALLDAGFAEKDAQGRARPVLMTLGDLSDPHHGLCYRLYNLWRENRNHDYVATGTFTPPAGEPWSQLQAHARSLSLAASTKAP